MSQAIISLKPRYARLVISGDKTVELRNRIVRLKPGTLIWIYATRPMARIVGIAEIESVVHADPAEIWQRFGDDICVDRNGFDSYIGNRERVSALVLRFREGTGELRDAGSVAAIGAGFSATTVLCSFATRKPAARCSRQHQEG